jgi:uncharacterized protein
MLGPWCQGFYAAMKLRLSAWALLRNLANVNQGPLMPILLHCVDGQGRPLLRPLKNGAEIAYKDIPEVVEAMRQY